MEYCPRCGSFSQKNKQEDQRHDPNCTLVMAFKEGEGGWKENPRWVIGEKPKMLPVTTANCFCGFCNKVFAPGVKTCRFCGRKTNPVTETHLQSNLVLSGMAAAPIWS
jgi:hypothetical protein